MNRSKKLKLEKSGYKLLETYEMGKMGTFFDIPSCRKKNKISDKSEKKDELKAKEKTQNHSHRSQISNVGDKVESSEPKKQIINKSDNEGFSELKLETGKEMNEFFVLKLCPTSTWICNRKKDLRIGTCFRSRNRISCIDDAKEK